MIILNEIAKNSVLIQNAIAKAEKIYNDPNSSFYDHKRAENTIRHLNFRLQRIDNSDLGHDVMYYKNGNRSLGNKYMLFKKDKKSGKQYVDLHNGTGFGEIDIKPNADNKNSLKGAIDDLRNTINRDDTRNNTRNDIPRENTNKPESNSQPPNKPGMFSRGLDFVKAHKKPLIGAGVIGAGIGAGYLYNRHKKKKEAEKKRLEAEAEARRLANRTPLERARDRFNSLRNK